MIVHLFNSSSVSGPERLVLPALAKFREHVLVLNLREERIARLLESDPLEGYAQSLGLPYRALRVRRRWDRGTIHELHQVLSDLRPDLVHAHAIKASVFLFQAARGSEPLSFPIVSTHHGAQGLPDWKMRLYEWLYRRHFLKSFDRVICVSAADRDFLLRSGIRKERLRLQLNGIDGRLVSVEDRPAEAHRVRALWLPQEADRDRLFLFGVIARLSPEKDHDRLFRVLSELNGLRCDRDWRCLVFGTGALEEKLRDRARSLGLDQRVLWMGYRHQVADELTGLDMVLSFSKAEGLPINLLEAGWAATPVMCTPVGGIKELIPDETYGQWVLPGEPVKVSARRMQTLLSKDGESALQGQRQRFQQRVTTEFTQETWSRRLQEVYAELHIAFEPLRHE